MYTQNSPAAGPGQSNPVTQQSQVVLNGRYDRYFTNYRKRQTANKRKCILAGPVEDEHFDIMPREIGMMLRQTHDADISRPINYEKDREIRIFTSANALPGLGCDDKEITSMDEQKKFRAHLRDQLVFAGIPQTKVLAGNDNQTDAVAVQVSGSVTIFNTGVFDINAFDFVCWDIPFATTKEYSGKKPVTPQGLPSGKMSFHTVPLRLGARDDAGDVPGARSIARNAIDDILMSLETSSNGSVGEFKAKKRKRADGEDTFWKRMVDSLFDAHGESDEVKKDRLKTVLTYWTHAHHRFHSRIIGVALSKARPGEPFDILLTRAM